MVRRNGSKLDAEAKARIKVEHHEGIAAKTKLQAERIRSRIRHGLVEPVEPTGDTSERSRTGVLLILVALIDTAFEWHLWTRAGGIIMGILVLSRVALLAYGAQKLRRKGSG